MESCKTSLVAFLDLYNLGWLLVLEPYIWIRTNASLFPSDLPENRASAFIINHPRRNVDIHTGTFLLSSPSRWVWEFYRYFKKGSERMEVENFYLRSPECLIILYQSRDICHAVLLGWLIIICLFTMFKGEVSDRLSNTRVFVDN